MDIFRGWKDYIGRLTENWQKKIMPEDTVVVAGDISWGMTLAEALEDFRFLHRLNGRKIILKGNHDYWFSTKTKVEQFLAAEGLTSIYILFNNAYRYEEYTICGTRGWFNEPGSTADSKVLLREAGRLKLSLEAGKKLGRKAAGFSALSACFFCIQFRRTGDTFAGIRCKALLLRTSARAVV